MIIKLNIEYDGSNYVGWQSQLNGKSIQGEIEKSLIKIFKRKIPLYVAGRTDAGVHALDQVAHFEIDGGIDIDPKKLCMAINYYLGKHNQIIITKSSKENLKFHSRFSASERIYLYKIFNRRIPSPLVKTRNWFVPQRIDINLIQSASDILIGTHDFNSFRSTACQSKNSIRTIKQIEVKKSGYEITLKFSAKSFLHNQVRIVVGSLVNVGRKFWKKEKIKEILDEKDRSVAGPTAPAHGLYLKKIIY